MDIIKLYEVATTFDMLCSARVFSDDMESVSDGCCNQRDCTYCMFYADKAKQQIIDSLLKLKDD